MKKGFLSIATSLASFAFIVAMFSNGAPSMWYLHQAKAPEKLSQFKK